MTSRLEIEQAIISAIVFGDGFSKVVNYLEARHFNEPMHQEIFRAAKSLYPITPIDMLTIGHALRLLSPESMEPAISLLLDIAAPALINGNCDYWALMLLQIDLTACFTDDLNIWLKNRQSRLQMIEAQAIECVLNQLTINKDPLLAIDKALRMFTALNMKLELHQVESYYYQVALDVAAIKRNNSLQLAAKAMTELSGCSKEVAYEVNRFTVAIANMIVTNKVLPEYTMAANLLKKAN